MLQVANIHMFIEYHAPLLQCRIFCINTSVVFAAVNISYSSESLRMTNTFSYLKSACRHYTYTQNAFQDFKFPECTVPYTIYKILTDTQNTLFGIYKGKNINTDCNWFYKVPWSGRTKRAYICTDTDTLKI